MLRALLALLLLSPATEASRGGTKAKQFEVLEGFKTVLLSHINTVLGSEKLPAAMGFPVEPGMFVTMTMERVQIFDRNVATLQAGQVTGPAAPECRSGCNAVLYNAFTDYWQVLQFEAAGLALEMPTRVLLAADANLPARTLVDVAYAAGETRPLQPPYFAILLNSGRAGLRAQTIYLVPPQGLRLTRQSAALGLTVEMNGVSYSVTAADPRFGRRIDVTGDVQLLAVLNDIRKRYPSKDSLVLVPKGPTTVGNVVGIIAAVRDKFPYIVLSGGQQVVVR